MQIPVIISTNIENIKLATKLLAIQPTNNFICTDSTFDNNTAEYIIDA